MINRMMEKAVKMQKQMMDTLEKKNPELFAQTTNKPVLCNYCGSKNERADKKCCNCGAVLKD